jgi:hypothetical protein
MKRVVTVGLVAVAASFFLAACGVSQEEARKKLDELKIPYTQEEAAKKLQEEARKKLDELKIPYTQEEARKKLDELKIPYSEEFVNRAGQGDVVAIKLFLASGMSPNVTIKRKIGDKELGGYTALMSASENNHAEVVKELLKAGADVNAKTNDGTTASMSASMKGHADIVELLKKAGATE